MKLYLFKILLSLLSLIVAIISLSIAKSLYLEANEIDTWPKISSTVSSLKVEERHLRRGRITYCPLVHVSFDLARHSYSSKLQISQEPCSPIQSDAQRFLEKFRVGETVEVFVNPIDPSNVRFVSYKLGFSFFALMFAGVIAAIGVVVLLLLPTSPKAR